MEPKQRYSLNDDADLEDFILDAESDKERKQDKVNVFDWDEKSNGSFEESSVLSSRPTDKDYEDFMETSLKTTNMAKTSEVITGPPWGGNAYGLSPGSKKEAEKKEDEVQKPVAQEKSFRSKFASATTAKLLAGTRQINWRGSERRQAETQKPKLPDQSLTSGMPKQSLPRDADDQTLIKSFDSEEYGKGTQSSPQMQRKDDISEVVEKMSQVSMLEYKRITNELSKSKQLITDLQKERWRALPAEVMVNRMLLGEPYSLAAYRSLREKAHLLAHVVKSNDGNAIIDVVFFLKRTLKPEIFINLISTYQPALDHYIQYLSSSNEASQLKALYKSLGRIVDCAMTEYEEGIGLTQASDKLQFLEQWLKEYGFLSELTETADIVREQIKLLKWQIPLEKRDKEREMEVGNTLFTRLPRKSSIVHQPLVTTSFYCALYHFDEGLKEYHPENLRKEFKGVGDLGWGLCRFILEANGEAFIQLTDKQFEWSVLPARAKLHKWTDFKTLLTGLDWKRKRSPKSAIGFDKVSIIVCTSGAPSEIREEYLSLIPKAEVQLKLAKKFQCDAVVIDALVTLKDRKALEEYRVRVEHNERLRRKITDLLRSTEIKWKPSLR